MSPEPLHTLELWHTVAAGFWAVCDCGWISSPAASRDEVFVEIQAHASNTMVTDSEHPA